MSSDDLNKQWMIDINVRPHKMSPIDPPWNGDDDDTYKRILFSLYSMTLADSLLEMEIDPYIIDHIEMEKRCSQQEDLCLIWSDDVSLSLCFLASLIHHGEYSPENLLDRYLEWLFNSYMCPAGQCFTPSVYIKKSIDFFSEILAAQVLNIPIESENKFDIYSPTPSFLIRMSPIAYYYSKHSPMKRFEVVQDYVRRMFGAKAPISIYIVYIELLVGALNGQPKEKLIGSISIEVNPNDLINKIFFDVVDILSNDDNNITYGIQCALSKIDGNKNNECKYLNPYDTNRSIILTLYLQISSALYKVMPKHVDKEIYAEKLIESFAKWNMYQRQHMI